MLSVRSLTKDDVLFVSIYMKFLRTQSIKTADPWLPLEHFQVMEIVTWWFGWVVVTQLNTFVKTH